MAASSRPRESLVRAFLPGLEFRDAKGDTKPRLSGHFSVFDTWTTIRSSFEGVFLEKVAKGAFKKTMSENRSGMRVLLNHGSDPELGDRPIGSIQELREDDTGAYYEVDLFDGVPAMVVDGLRAGAYGASFRFSVMNEDYVERPKRSQYNPDGLPERVIKEARVAEFGPVTWGAYPDATAQVRSLTDRFLLDALAEHPDSLRELIQDRKTRTVVAMSPNARVTFSSRGDAIEEKLEQLDEPAVFVTPDYAADQPELVALMRDAFDKFHAPHPEEEVEEREEMSEPEPSAATTPVPGSTEPERSAATTHPRKTETGLYLPTRKATPLWQL